MNGISGNLTRDPEVREFAGGKTVVRLGIAHNRKVGDNEYTDFWNLTVWNGQGQRVAKQLKKGDRIVASGEFRNEAYTTEDGQTRTRPEFVVREIGASLLFEPKTA